MRRDDDDNNDVHSDVSMPRQPRRVEILNGIERRRSWSDETKIAIVAETLQPGVVISHVARRYDINPSQLFGWIKIFRQDALALIGMGRETEAPAFVPTVMDDTHLAACLPSPPLSSPPEPASIEISIGPATLRVCGAVDARTLATVLKALKVFG